MNWLDKIIEEQKINTDIMNSICYSGEPSLSPAELQEMAEREGWA